MKPAAIAAWLMPVCMAAVALGDMPIAEVAPGIYRGPAPETAADYGQLKALGIRTVLDIRKFRRRLMDAECRCVVTYGMTYKRAPVSFWPQKDGSAERAVCTLADARLYPIYIHCELGRDRSGLIIALYRVRYQGWSPQAAYCEMKRFGFKSYFRAMECYFWDCAPRGI